MKSSKPARDARFDADTRLRSLGDNDNDSDNDSNDDSPLESMGEAIGEVVTGGLVGDRSATGGIGPAAAEDDLPSADVHGDTRKRPVARRQGPSSGR